MDKTNHVHVYSHSSWFSSVSDEAEAVHIICGESYCGLRVPVEICIIMSVYSEGRGAVSSVAKLRCVCCCPVGTVRFTWALTGTERTGESRHRACDT